MILRKVGESRSFFIGDKTFSVEIVDVPTDTGVTKGVVITDIDTASEVTLPQEALVMIMGWLT
jgi:hypothetical protein